jgi:hypothetical protein
MAAEGRPRRWLLGGAAALLVAAGLYAALRWAQAPLEGPAPVAYDRASCTRCRMLIGEPAYAAQIEWSSGDVSLFDDPGCLLLYLDEHPDEVRAIWFHHVREDRWIPGDKVAFEPASPTPMGYGLGAVDAGTPGAFSRAEALARARAREASRRGARAP